MLARYPFELPKDRKLSKREIAQALRWAMEAELDAVSIYEQLAEGIEDERIKKIFYDVVSEEKTHFGEFLAALFEVDSELADEMKEGFQEVQELTGMKIDFFKD
ncbi:MAG: rubrerythrin family protein [Archaeoglobi archaeon]|nr:rubrerythrin family protein [Candidatus Mnemosynella bozhongmuii]